MTMLSLEAHNSLFLDIVDVWGLGGSGGRENHTTRSQIISPRPCIGQRAVANYSRQRICLHRIPPCWGPMANMAKGPRRKHVGGNAIHGMVW